MAILLGWAWSDSLWHVAQFWTSFLRLDEWSTGKAPLSGNLWHAKQLLHSTVIRWRVRLQNQNYFIDLPTQPQFHFRSYEIWCVRAQRTDSSVDATDFSLPFIRRRFYLCRNSFALATSHNRTAIIFFQMVAHFYSNYAHKFSASSHILASRFDCIPQPWAHSELAFRNYCAVHWFSKIIDFLDSIFILLTRARFSLWPAIDLYTHIDRGMYEPI